MSDYLHDRTEAEWEQYLQEDDVYSARCFQLLKRYLHMPGGDSLLSRQLAKEFPSNLPGGMLAGWEYAEEMRSGSEDPELDGQDFRDSPEDGGREAGPEEGKLPWQEQNQENRFSAHPFWANTKEIRDQLDMLNGNARAILSVLLQCISDWCNILPLTITPKGRPLGMQVLFRLSRGFCNFKRGIDGLFACLSLSNVAVFKRSLQDIQVCRGIIEQFALQSQGELRKLLSERATFMRNCADNLEKLMADCRELVIKHGNEGRF